MADIPDRVSLDLVMELVEMQVGPDPGYDLTALALGVSRDSLTRYKREGTVPRDRAEWLYDRLARGIVPQAKKLRHWEWPDSFDEKSQKGREAQLRAIARRKAS